MGRHIAAGHPQADAVGDEAGRQHAQRVDEVGRCRRMAHLGQQPLGRKQVEHAEQHLDESDQSEQVRGHVGHSGLKECTLCPPHFL